VPYGTRTPLRKLCSVSSPRLPYSFWYVSSIRFAVRVLQGAGDRTEPTDALFGALGDPLQKVDDLRLSTARRAAASAGRAVPPYRRRPRTPRPPWTRPRSPGSRRTRSRPARWPGRCPTPRISGPSVRRSRREWGSGWTKVSGRVTRTGPSWNRPLLLHLLEGRVVHRFAVQQRTALAGHVDPLLRRHPAGDFDRVEAHHRVVGRCHAGFLSRHAGLPAGRVHKGHRIVQGVRIGINRLRTGRHRCAGVGRDEPGQVGVVVPIAEVDQPVVGVGGCARVARRRDRSAHPGAERAVVGTGAGDPELVDLEARMSRPGPGCSTGRWCPSRLASGIDPA